MSRERIPNDRPIDADAHTSGEADTSAPHKRRVWRWLVVGVVLLVGGSLYIHAFLHRSLHSDDWLQERAEQAIVRGLDALTMTYRLHWGLC